MPGTLFIELLMQCYSNTKATSDLPVQLSTHALNNKHARRNVIYSFECSCLKCNEIKRSPVYMSSRCNVIPQHLVSRRGRHTLVLNKVPWLTSRSSLCKATLFFDPRPLPFDLSLRIVSASAFVAGSQECGSTFYTAVWEQKWGLKDFLKFQLVPHEVTYSIAYFAGNTVKATQM